MAFVGGYAVLLPGKWDFPTFIFSYTMIGVFPLLFFGWKVLKRTKSHRPEEVDLVKNLDEIEEHEANYRSRPARNAFARALDYIFG